jgi:hypothetical protein
VLRAPEDVEDAYVELLRDKGNAHERAYLDKLKADGRSVREIERVESLDEMTEATRQAMRDGVDVIYQGALRSGQWHGYSDFLVRVDVASDLGAYSYEVAEIQDQPLMPGGRRRRHQQLAVDQLVARREAFTLVDEAFHLGSRPTSRTNGWHGHNLLGGRNCAQLGMVHDCATFPRICYQTKTAIITSLQVAARPRCPCDAASTCQGNKRESCRWVAD